MRRIKDAFEDKKTCIAYLTAGDPDIETTKELILSMEQVGVDIIEIGIPSDSIPENLVELKRSNSNGLKSGVSADDIFTMVETLSKTIRTPLLILAYLDSIKEYGITRFMRKCKECSVAGLVIPDLIMDETNEIIKDCNLFGVELITVVRPGTREQIAAAVKKAKGFVYCEAPLEEMHTETQSDFSEMVAIVRSNASVPCVLGFGIHTPDEAKRMARISDGVVIGKGIVKATIEYGQDCVRPVTDYVRTIRAAIRQL